MLCGVGTSRRLKARASTKPGTIVIGVVRVLGVSVSFVCRGDACTGQAGDAWIGKNGCKRNAINGVAWSWGARQLRQSGVHVNEFREELSLFADAWLDERRSHY